jgi:hypothetical protein
MNKKAFVLIQHKLIPTALIAGNIGLAHLIYLLEKGGYSYLLVLTILSVIVLTTAIIRPHKYLLLTGIFFYAVVLSLTFL